MSCQGDGATPKDQSADPAKASSGILPPRVANGEVCWHSQSGDSH